MCIFEGGQVDFWVFRLIEQIRMSKIKPFDLPFERFYLLVVDRLKIVIILQPQIFLVLVLPIFLNLLLLLEFLAGVLK